MFSSRRIRPFVLTCILVSLIIWYYHGFPDTHFGWYDNGSKLPPSSLSSTDEGHPLIQPPILGPSLPSSPDEGHSGEGQTKAPSTESSISINPTGVPKGQTPGPVTSSDVLLIFKTGASTIWKRMPLHLTTTLSDARIPHSVIYSDLSERLANSIESINVLANVSNILKSYDADAYASYKDLPSPLHINTYREYGGLPGDEPQDVLLSNPPGWRLDKYKFIPMLTHAQRNWPNLKWYIYIEDDTFIFLDNLLLWLSTLSPDDEPSYYGGYSGGSNETFAQGGSGIVFSGSLMRTVFGGTNTPSLETYGNYTFNSCCGDVILGKVLRDHGISVNRGEYGSVSFRPEPPWKTGFEEWMWCSPVFTFHHLHQRDLSQLFQLERKHGESSRADRPILFRDIFTALIWKYLIPQRKQWDNFASRYVLTSNSLGGFPIDTVTNGLHKVMLAQASTSPNRCENACKLLDDCLSWRHEVPAESNAEGVETCALDMVVKLGRELDPLKKWEKGREVVSGWMVDRIEERLMRDSCETWKWNWG